MRGRKTEQQGIYRGQSITRVNIGSARIQCGTDRPNRALIAEYPVRLRQITRRSRRHQGAGKTPIQGRHTRSCQNHKAHKYASTSHIDPKSRMFYFFVDFWY